MQPWPRLTGVAVSKRSLEEILPEAAQDVENLFPTGRRPRGDAPTPPRPEKQRVWARWLKGDGKVMGFSRQSVAEAQGLRNMRE